MKSEIQNDKEVLLAGPYNQKEAWMLRNAIVQLGTIKHRVHVDKNGHEWLYRTRAGYREIRTES